MIGYHVFVRHAESARFFPESWVWNGMYDATAIGSFDSANVFVLVENLISKSSFEFRLSAFNVIGNSSISVISNSAFTANTSTVPIKDHPNSDVVYGAGVQARAQSRNWDTQVAVHGVSASLQPQATLSIATGGSTNTSSSGVLTVDDARQLVTDLDAGEDGSAVTVSAE